MFPVATGALLGIRDARQIAGDYVVNLNDCKRRAVLPDEIGHYSFPVEIHPASPDKTEYQRFRQQFESLKFGKEENYGIPSAS